MPIQKYSAQTDPQPQPPNQPPGGSGDPPVHRPPRVTADSRRTQERLPVRTGRARAAWGGYRDVQQDARYHSNAWWLYKIMQGVILGGGLAIAASVLLVLNALSADDPWLARAALLLLVIGVLVCVRYLAAPLLARWIVTVPENRYYVVVDGDGYTLEYLGPGRLIVPFRWNAHIRPYVDFDTITVNVHIENALDSRALPVEVEVSLVMVFNPVRADPDLFPTLRRMTTPDAFERLLARDLRDIIDHHLAHLDPTQELAALEDLIAAELEPRAALGLFPAPRRPVIVRVRAPQTVTDAYRALSTHATRQREDTRLLEMVRRLARELGVSDDEALRLFYLMRRGDALDTPLPREAPPVYVVHSPPATPPARATEEHPPAVPEEPPLPSVIDDPNYTPDPLAQRRARRDARRSRRLDG